MSRNIIPFFGLLAVISVVPDRATAMLDFIGQTAKDSVKAAAYADAVAELSSEMNDRSPVTDAASDLARRTSRLKNQVTDVYFATNEFKSLLHGPDWSSAHLDENIRYTTRYIRRARKFFVQLGLLGTDVATAMNTAETNSALNEMLKNQQTQILLTKELQVDQAEKEVAREKAWRTFIEVERSKRNQK